MAVHVQPFTLAGPIATILAAGAAVYVTWRLGQSQLGVAKQQAEIAKQQAQLAEVRLRHDLFDRRYKIYDAARSLVIAVFHRTDISQEEFFSYVSGTSDGVFLLDTDLVAYLERLRQKALRLQHLNRLINEPPPEPEPDQATAPAEKARLSTWFVAQNDVLVAKFRPFLALDQ